uniref:G_PROTEIN_RECEP_F1_2 domain-containing protein n=1 Tax=Steinernema glaseri TaxID=37863 RepID=A0A1I8AJW3_9BILA
MTLIYYDPQFHKLLLTTPTPASYVVPTKVQIPQMPTGVLIIIFSTLFFALHALIVFTIRTSKKYAGDTTHLIIAHISVAAAVQLFCLMYAGLLTTLDAEISSVVNKVLGAIDMHVYTTMYLLLFVLAVNRLAIFSELYPLSTLQRPLPTKVMIALSWLLGAYFSAILLSSLSRYTFSHKTLEWQFEKNELFAFLNKSYIVFVIPPTVGTLLLYVCISSIVYRMRKKTTFAARCRPEVKFLVFNAIVFVMATIVLWITVAQDKILPRPPVSGAILTTYWIFECGVHAVVLLVLDSCLRRQVLKFVPARNKVSTSIQELRI